MTVPFSASITLLAAIASAAPVATAPAPAPATPTSLAPVVVEGLTIDAAARLEAALRRQFEARPGAVADTVARPAYEAARKNGLTCDVTLPDCLAQVGVVQGVDVIVLARLGRDSLELVAIDVSSARALRRARGPLRAPVLEADVATVFDRLAAPAAAVTTLSITAPSGATVEIDDVSQGMAPVAVVAGLAPGPHRVRVGLDGAVAEATVEVLLGEPTTLTLMPEPEGDDGGTDGRRSPRPAMARSTVPLIVGGSLATVGALMFAVGGLSWLEVVDASGQLQALQDRAADGAPVDEAFLGDTRVARDRFDAASVGWTGVGQPMVALGLGVAGAGVGVVTAALVLARE